MNYSHLAFALAILFILYAAYTSHDISLLNDKISSLEISLNNANSATKSLNSSLKEKTKELNSANQKIIILEQNLSQKQQELADAKARLEKTSQSLALSQQKVNETKKEMQNLKHELNLIEGSINDSMSWFSQNSQLNRSYSWDVDTFVGRVKKDCIYGGELNLACINYLTQRTSLRLEYKEDLDAGETDHLQSLSQTIERRGGDCEDYSLFLKAVLNTLKNEGEDVKIKSWENGGGRFRVWPQQQPEGVYYYYSNAKEKIIANLSSAYPYVICYAVDSYSGHCRIALSQNKITNQTGPFSLEGAQVFEPQSGKYAGRVGKEYSVCNESQAQCYTTSGKIVIAITNNDFYKIENKNWSSFATLLQKLAKIKQNMG